MKGSHTCDFMLEVAEKPLFERYFIRFNRILFSRSHRWVTVGIKLVWLLSSCTWGTPSDVMESERQSMRAVHDVNPQSVGSLLQGLQSCLSLPKRLKACQGLRPPRRPLLFFAYVALGDAPYLRCFLSTSHRRLLYGLNFRMIPKVKVDLRAATQNTLVTWLRKHVTRHDRTRVNIVSPRLCGRVNLRILPS